MLKRRAQGWQLFLRSCHVSLGPQSTKYPANNLSFLHYATIFIVVLYFLYSALVDKISLQYGCNKHSNTACTLHRQVVFVLTQTIYKTDALDLFKR